MASTDAKPVPQKNVAYRVTFPIFDADGDLVTGATALDSEVSKDGGTFADCTNEATEIATSSGMYYLDLTSTEMNADTVAIIVKTTSTGAKTTPIVLYPEEAGDIRVNVTQVAGTTQTAGDIIGDTNDIQTRLPAALVSGRMDASVGAMASNVLTAAAINAAALNGKGDWNIGKTGYALSSAGVQAIWDALTSALTTVGSIGKLLVDNINATISSRSTYAGGDTAGTTTLLSRIVGTLAAGTHNPQGGDAYARLGAPAGASVSADIAAIQAKTTNLPAAPAATGDIPTAAAIADQVWDEAIAGHLTAGSTGNALNSAGSAGDPWGTALPGAYGAGTAGKIIGDNLNAPVATVDTVVDAIKVKTDQLVFTVANQVDANALTGGGGLDAAGVRAAVGLASANLDTQLSDIDNFVDTEVSAIKAKTDQLTFTSANKVDATLNAAGDLPAAVANKIADHTLRRTYANARASSDGDAVSFRSLLGAIAKLVNKWSISGATLTVYHEDDATSAGTQAITSDAAAEPITALDT